MLNFFTNLRWCSVPFPQIKQYKFKCVFNLNPEGSLFIFKSAFENY